MSPQPLPLSLLSALLIAVLSGCAGPTDERDHSDADGDGIEAWEELELGTDPDAADSDGDGFDDSTEIEGNTSPIDDSDHPYEGGWAVGPCRDSVEATGDEEGDIANDWALPDQFGDTIRLHSFCDRAVLLVAAAFW